MDLAFEGPTAKPMSSPRERRPVIRHPTNHGTTFVTLARESPGKEPGFWMSDSMLEVWLRLLALHLPEPTDSGEHQATIAIRNQWLLASRGYFIGCVPHGMEEACATQEGRNVVRTAIDSFLAALYRTDERHLMPAP